MIKRFFLVAQQVEMKAVYKVKGLELFCVFVRKIVKYDISMSGSLYYILFDNFKRNVLFLIFSIFILETYIPARVRALKKEC